ncbi:MAG: Sensor protein ZraS [candidate division BRC1 bacterium ADurb.BinA364]|nr:MAG: Sensor protein ZraS [candidate division BRC1 bacterium ADurb.BinA364]
MFACVIDENHNVVVSDFRDDATREILQGEIGEYEASFSHGDRALQVILERQPAPWPVITAPLPREARPGLRLAFAVNESEIYKRIADAGSRITRRVAGMTAVLCLALVLAFGAVWRLVARNERLLAENEGLSRQAYVASLASGVAHQIRNPLNAMCVNLDVIEEDLNDPRADSADRMRRLVRRLKTEARQLEGVVGGFLRFALPRATRPEPIRLALPIRAALEELEDEIAMRKATVELDLDERLEARGDAEGLRQVAHNLALNALQAMTGPERRLAIRARARGAQAVVAFEDTGEGIPPDRLERLFEVGGSTKPAGGGFGLAIVRRIVDDHGGAISVESAEGKGTKIEIRFPLISSPARR